MIILRKIQTIAPSTAECVGIAEELLGTIDSNNQIFNTQNDYESGTVSVLYNGQALHAPDDFTEDGGTQITFIYIAPRPDDVLRVSYKYASCSGTLSSAEKGKQNIANGVDQQFISFSSVFSSTNYVLTTNLTNIVDSTPSVFPYIVGSKSTNGFTVYFQGEIDSSNYVLEWIAMEL